MLQKLNSKNILSYKKWIELKKSKKKKVINFYKKFINNYNYLNNKYFFNQELSRKYILNQIKNLDEKKSNKLKFLPVGIKDNINTRYLTTNYGLKLKKKFKVGNNANIVDKISNNGGVIFSKTTCAEFAVHHINYKLGTNPHDYNHIAGTSSTGSAIAVACGALPATLGTQTAGSIIRPSSFCGVYGFKPTFGAIDRTGVLKNNDLFDTVGIIASEIQFIELLFKNVLNFSKDYPWTKNYYLNFLKFKNRKKIKIGYINDTLDIYKDSSKDVKKFYHSILKKLKKKFNLKPLNGHLFKKFHYYHDILYNKSLSYYIKSYTSKKNVLSKILRGIVKNGENISDKTYNDALNKINRIKIDIKKLTKKYDFIVVPSTFSQAPLKNKTEIKDTCLIWTTMRFPCLNIPFKFKNKNLPFGLLIVSSEFNDFALLKFCKKISQKKIFNLNIF